MNHEPQTEEAPLTQEQALLELQASRLQHWPDRDKACLHRMAEGQLEPLGFFAMDLMLPKALAGRFGGWIPNDESGCCLYLATPEQFYHGKTRRFQVPLYVWLTHRTVRLLYLSTPSDIDLLCTYMRLAAGSILNVKDVQECSPAALSSMIQRWLRADPQLSVLRSPMLPEDAEELNWAVSTSRALDHEGDAIWAQLEGQFGKKRAKLMSYTDDLPILAPLVLLAQRVSTTPRELLDRLSEGEALKALGGPGMVWVSARPGELSLITRLYAPTWHRLLGDLRDEVEAITGGEAIYIMTPHSKVVSLCKQVKNTELSGKDEVCYPPYSDARPQPVPEESRELWTLILRLVAGVPEPEEGLQVAPLLAQGAAGLVVN